jgi:hypothetical protein
MVVRVIKMIDLDTNISTIEAAFLEPPYAGGGEMNGQISARLSRAETLPETTAQLGRSLTRAGLLLAANE